jgi:uncharacterized OsmC-like protein
MSDMLHVRHLGDDRFAVDVRGHTVMVDQPFGAGGTDVAPTPTELFVAALASCVGFYARRYLMRHSIDADGLAVSASYEIGGRPARVRSLKVLITPPPALPVERRDAFLAVASHCTVHNTLTAPADVAITLAAPSPARSGV